jgi:Zn finger protein HypA/HybF involved in hydrogenase expression
MLIIIITFTLILILAYYIDIKFLVKKCPYCKEYINKKAIKCPHCQSDLKR